MPEEKPDPKVPDVDLQKKLEEMQKAEDEAFMKGYQDASLEDLISKNYISHKVEVVKGLTMTIRTLRKKEELFVKGRIASYNGAQMYVVDQINTDTLVYAIVDINGVSLPGPLPEKFDQAKEQLSELSDAVLIAAMEEYRNLNKALVILARGSSKNSLARHLLGRESA